MRFLRAFLLFWRNAGLPKAVEWGPEEARALQQFLSTTTGAKLRMILLSQVAEQNESAVIRHTEFQCGLAAGYKLFWAIFASLIPPSSMPADDNAGESEYQVGAPEDSN